MIRVTLDEKQYIYEGMYKGNEGKIYFFENGVPNTWIFDIEKIEKQVKDLTSEEMIKLEISIVYDTNKQAYIVIDMWDNELSLEDYIDITKLKESD